MLIARLDVAPLFAHLVVFLIAFGFCSLDSIYELSDLPENGVVGFFPDLSRCLAQ